MNNSSRIIIIRHGEGQHNVGNFYSGDPQQPGYIEAFLTEKGRAQARHTGRSLLKAKVSGEQVGLVLSSPLPRALETSKIIMNELAVSSARLKTDHQLIEASVGEREGTNIDSYNDPDSWFPEKPEAFGGETRSQIRSRIMKAFNDVVTQICNGSQTTLIVSHGAPLFLLIEAVTGTGVRLDTAGFQELPVRLLEQSVNKK